MASLIGPFAAGAEAGAGKAGTAAAVASAGEQMLAAAAAPELTSAVEPLLGRIVGGGVPLSRVIGSSAFLEQLGLEGTSAQEPGPAAAKRQRTSEN